MIEKILNALQERSDYLVGMFEGDGSKEDFMYLYKIQEAEHAKEIVQKVAKEYDWISVTKKLPEEHKRALVELSNGWQVVATHDGEEWVLVWHYYMPIETDYVKVVQWRYLDAPYQKGEQYEVQIIPQGF